MNLCNLLGVSPFSPKTSQKLYFTGNHSYETMGLQLKNSLHNCHIVSQVFKINIPAQNQQVARYQVTQLVKKLIGVIMALYGVQVLLASKAFQDRLPEPVLLIPIEEIWSQYCLMDVALSLHRLSSKLNELLLILSCFTCCTCDRLR